jgi:uncharacterized protein
MKYLLLLLVALLIIWQWRSYRDRQGRDKPPPRGSAEQPIHMAACLHCGTHVAASESVQGGQGSYCSAEHRQRHES